jgi:hypothetical protein
MLFLKRQHQDTLETNKYEKIHSISLEKELERKKYDSDKEVNLLILNTTMMGLF